MLTDGDRQHKMLCKLVLCTSVLGGAINKMIIIFSLNGHCKISNMGLIIFGRSPVVIGIKKANNNVRNI